MSTREALGAAWELNGYPCEMGAYLLLRSLARGGMGEVHLAKHGGLAGIQKYCVVKTLKSFATQDEEYVRRFVDEAAVVVSLQHKNICPVFDVGKVKGRYYLAMEFIAGRDLRSLTQTAAERGIEIPPDVALFVVGEVLEALDYAHRARDPNTGEPLDVVHRDISPQNIMLSFEGEAKLIDFGLAASALKKERTNPNIVLGKLAYMPPEQLDGKGLDGRADLFAAAVVLYELLARERYYADMTDADIMLAASGRTFVPRKLKDFDPELQTILRDALNPDRTQRLPTCGELKDRITRYQVARRQHASSRDLRRLLETVFPDDVDKTRSLLAQFASRRAPVAVHNEQSQRIAIAAHPEPPDPPALRGIEELASMSDDMLRAAAKPQQAPELPESAFSPIPGSMPLDPMSLTGAAAPRRDSNEPTEPTRDVALPTPQAPAIAMASPVAADDPFARAPTSAPNHASEATVVIARIPTGDVSRPPPQQAKGRALVAASVLLIVASVGFLLFRAATSGGTAPSSPTTPVVASATPPPPEPPAEPEPAAAGVDDPQPVAPEGTEVAAASAGDPQGEPAQESAPAVDEEKVALGAALEEASGASAAADDDDDEPATAAGKAHATKKKAPRRKVAAAAPDKPTGVAWQPTTAASAEPAPTGAIPKLRASAKPEQKIRFLEIYCAKSQRCATKLISDFRGMRVTDAKVFWSKVDACVLICSPGSLQ